MTALKVVSYLLFGSCSIYPIVSEILVSAGYWRILQKCGLPGWKAVIPGYKNLMIAKCADRESEGRVVFVTYIVSTVLGIVSVFLGTQTKTGPLQSGLLTALGIVGLIYSIRISLGVIELFGLKKKWLWMWIISDFIPAILWGFSDRYQPRWKVQDIENEVAGFFSGSHADVMEKGMTVNLEERSVTESFTKKYLLRDIHMYIEPGSMVLLLGGSGAGKTTLINAINGYEKAKAEIVLNGTNVYDEYKKMQHEFGFVPQQDLMRGDDTVFHTLTDAAALRLPINFGKEEREKRVEEVMDMFGLTPVKDSLVEKLSGGQRKRLSIAMEFIPNPSLFILDEPDSGLDGVMARDLMKHLRNIADQGKIVIVITHTPDRVSDLFDHVIVLAKDANRTGRLAYYGSISEARQFFDREKMEDIVRCINRTEEGGEGRADEFIKRYTEVQHGLYA